MWGFGKKDKKEAGEKSFSLPELPKLPEFPELKEEEANESKKVLHQLPSFPSNPIGEKFSQNTIKDAVTGNEKEDSGKDFEWEDEEVKEPIKKSLIKEVSSEEIEPPMQKKEFRTQENFPKVIKKIEPVFIRIDKFEESLKIFEKTKEKILEIEHMLNGIQDIREKEDEELQIWENNMKKMKEEVEKVDREIFSKVE